MTGRARSVSIYRSLLGNLAVVIVVLSGAIMALTFAGSRETVRRLSGVILGETTARIDQRLQGFFDPVVRDLHLLRAWGEAGVLDVEDAAVLNRLLVPLLRANPPLSAVMVADERGRGQNLFHFGDRWSSRQTRPDEWGSRVGWLEWTEERPEAVALWKESDYDPRTRPWFQGAVKALTGSPGSDAVYWTEPYTFYTAKAPGVTAALAFRGRDGRARVVGFDVLLSDISAFTTRLRAGENGQVMVLTDDNRVIGLPRDALYVSVTAQQQALLRRPDELGMPLAADATRMFRSRPPGEGGPMRLHDQGAAWWVDMTPFRLGAERLLSIAVMVPESDLLGSLGYLRLGIILVMLGGLAIAIARAARLARRYSRPIEALVKESERISRGDLEPGPVVVTTITEMHRLADAHERMRLSVRTLLKLESDLLLARRIQQDTLPEQIPTVKGFDIGAWNEPADETGGDTYDVIGYELVPGQSAPRLSSTEADRAVLLLADATGHGIGPALSVTQVRAMLRMAIRLGEDLPGIIHHLNAQLCGDLTEGRFVSAWLGEVDAKDRTLRSFSCGQGPLLYYRAQEQAWAGMETDTVPLGCLDELEAALREPIVMRPGDVFVALSDGIVETMNPEGELFGTKRVIDVISERCDGSVAEMLAALREALTAFAGTRPADDDRTVVIVKRE